MLWSKSYRHTDTYFSLFFHLEIQMHFLQSRTSKQYPGKNPVLHSQLSIYFKMHF